jgi:hypothetical protein
MAMPPEITSVYMERRVFRLTPLNRDQGLMPLFGMMVPESFGCLAVMDTPKTIPAGSTIYGRFQLHASMFSLEMLTVTDMAIQTSKYWFVSPLRGMCQTIRTVMIQSQWFTRVQRNYAMGSIMTVMELSMRTSFRKHIT